MLSFKVVFKSVRHRGYIFFFAVLVVLTFSSWGSLNYSSNRFKAGYKAYQLSVTEHQINNGTQKLSYSATTGYMPLKQGESKADANIFYVAYTANRDTIHSDRPITFVFNGGPGSASIWLHMGSFGPVRVLFKNDKGDAPKQGYQYADNPYTWLGFTDMVFIDPVSTGYSRAEDGADTRYHSYNADISCIGQFIRQYLVQHHRQNSPKFLAGESYGAIRAVGLTAYLHDEYKIAINGLTLISPALNYQLIKFDHGNETPYSYYLPSYALAAQYHGLLSSRLQQLTPEQLLAKATLFAHGIYTLYLNQSDQASAELTSSVVDSLHEFTGLAKSKITEMNGRITDSHFCKLLLQNNNEVIGGFDSRFLGKTQQNVNADPSETNLRDMFTSAFSEYVTGQLKYHNNLPYLATTATNDWNYGTNAANSYLDVSEVLKKVMVQNPNLKINVVCGLYDLATPVGSTEYVIHHLGLKPALRNNISMNYYASGHMIYISATADNKFLKDGDTFYHQVLNTININ